MYEYGLSVEQDYKKAFDFYKKAAELNNHDAQRSLAFLYENGYGVPKDQNQANFWYRKTREQK